MTPTFKPLSEVRTETAEKYADLYPDDDQSYYKDGIYEGVHRGFDAGVEEMKKRINALIESLDCITDCKKCEEALSLYKQSIGE